MIQIFVNKENNRVEGTYNGSNLIEGWIVVDAIPQPESKKGFSPVLKYNSEERELYYEYEKFNLITEDTSNKQLIIAKIRQRYSIDDELAILRQRDTKPTEFEEYFEFVEQTKKEVKESPSISGYLE